MKQYITRFLKSVAICYMAFPALYIVICALLFDMPIWACVRVLLSPGYYVVSALAIAAGYGFWEMKRWSWYTFVIANILIVYENAIMVNDYGATYHKGLSFGFSLVLITLLTYWVAREIRVPYFFPKIRWWESDPRYRLSVPVQLELAETEDAHESMTGDILDLSLGGCFVKLRSELVQDEKVTLNFTVFQIPVRCQGIVVWRTQSTVTHPKGVGVKFFEMERNERRRLKLINQRLKTISSFYKRSRYLMNQDEFVKRLQELEAMPLRKQRSKANVG